MQEKTKEFVKTIKHTMNMYDEIGFTPEMLRRTRMQSKIHTLRVKRYGEAGDILMIKGTDEYIKLISVQKIPIKIVAEYLCRCEGCLSKDHFIATWESIHPEKGYVSEEKYWGHFYVYLGDNFALHKKICKAYKQSELLSVVH